MNSDPTKSFSGKERKKKEAGHGIRGRDLMTLKDDETSALILHVGRGGESEIERICLHTS